MGSNRYIEIPVLHENPGIVMYFFWHTQHTARSQANNNHGINLIISEHSGLKTTYVKLK